MHDTTKQHVFQYIDDHADDIVALLTKLVSYKTINLGDGIHGDEGEMQEYFAELMADSGFTSVEKLAFDSEKHRPNVVGKVAGTGGGRSLLFNGHSDVVPIAFPERWKANPFTATEIDGKIYGRGTSDMKGGLVGAFFAITSLLQCGVKLQGDVLLESVVGEESQSSEDIGTSRVTDAGYTADFGIVCEPSNLEIQTASSALVFFKLIVEGKGVHVSARNQMLFPQGNLLTSGEDVAVDAFEKSLPLVDFIRRYEVELNHRFRHPVLGRGGVGGHDQQGVGVFTINPAKIEGGEYLGTVPSHIEYTYSVWYPDSLITRDELLDEIRSSIQAIASTDSWLREHPPVIEAPIIQDWPGFYVPIEQEGVQQLRKTIDQFPDLEPVISGFKAVCDAYYLNKMGIPTIVLGPGAISYSVHGDNEFINRDDLITATKVYAAFMIDWCGIA
jgi:acetylornithine deacetylase